MNLELLRYIMAGIGTTFINLVVFSILKYGVHMETQIANVISILFAIAFAFVINKSFVFGQKGTENLRKECFRFVSMRMISMGVEVLGMYGLTELSSVPDLAAKVILQVVVIGMNYIISKFYIFQEDRK